MFPARSASTLLAVLLSLVGAQDDATPTRVPVVQDDWIFPRLPDFDAKLTIGTTYSIQWTRNLFRWFPQYAPSANPGNVDLWLQSADSDSQILLEIAFNVNETTSFDWLADVPDDMLARSNRYAFQFRPAGAKTPFDEISSPGVVVLAKAVSSSSTTIAETSSVSTSTSGSSVTAAGQTSSSSSAGVSPGGIAGIVIGTIAVILIGVGVFLLWKRRGVQATREAEGVVDAAVPKEDAHQYQYGAYQPVVAPVEAPDHHHNVSMLDGTPREPMELPADYAYSGGPK